LRNSTQIVYVEGRGSPPAALDVDEDAVEHGGENNVVDSPDDVERPQGYEEPRLVQRAVPGTEGFADEGSAEKVEQHARRYRHQQRP